MYLCDYIYIYFVIIYLFNIDHTGAPCGNNKLNYIFLNTLVHKIIHFCSGPFIKIYGL